MGSSFPETRPPKKLRSFSNKLWYVTRQEILPCLVFCYESSPSIKIAGYNYEAALRRLVGEGRLRVP